MSGSKKPPRVYRDSWVPEHVAILCGIANAGGGVLTVASISKNYSRGLKRIRRSFEQIPQLAQKELGIVCTTQPVLEGQTLCLEIDVPAADPNNPIRYRGSCCFFDIATDNVVSLDPEEISSRRMKEAPSEPQHDFDALDTLVTAADAEMAESETQATGNEEQRENDMFLLFSQLATQLEQMGGSVAVAQDKSSVTFAFPQQNNGAGAQEEAQPDTEAQQPETRIRQVDPNAKVFAKRSVAAANGFNLTSTDEYILRILNTNGRATALRIAEVLGVSESTVRRSFRRLKELDLIVRVGSPKAGYWRVND